MRREGIRTLVLPAFAAIAGWVAWSGLVLLLPVALAFPVLWSLAQSRRTAALVSAAYFLAASRGLPQGIAAFYQSDLWPGLLLWLVASVSFVMVHALLWTPSQGRRPLRYLLACLLTAIPPFGITGWAHPITSAGVVFPEWGWWGLAATTAGLMGLTSRIRPAVTILLAGFWLWSAAFWTMPKIPVGWQGVDLDLGASLGRDAGLTRQRALIAIAQERAAAGIGTVLLPESAIGSWTPTVERLWTTALEDRPLIVLAGAVVITPHGYDNVLVAVSQIGGRILYLERMPVPGSMWQPWRSWMGVSGGVRANVFSNPVVDLGGRKLAPLICYEMLLVWPVLHSMLYDPDIIVAVGNGWWTVGTSIVSIQRASATAWAHLFGKPLVLAFNT
ncbi:conjugal transfer protein TraB [Rhizobium sp. KAs_5_22]|uniref:conjugal transfer protein TraB n=1 Tax=Ciceribacter selenitireducens TaxID=448181 RepID=UPI00048C5094|nr:conjugal transfer protein TraB [Ciceribacter selenitireducens]PPJ49196.1 conjugal transfer protein TraB [Rhizobium sp. KAs_5_22]